jgi:hypothetical protein
VSTESSVANVDLDSDQDIGKITADIQSVKLKQLLKKIKQ